MAPSKLFALFIFAAVTAVQSQSPTPMTASNDCHFIKAINIKGIIKAMDNCTYPSDQINAGCLSASCPEVWNETVCPNGNANQKDLQEKNLQVVLKCLQKPEICGIAVNPIHIPKLIFVANQLFTGTGFRGTCWVGNNTSAIYNLDDTNLSLVEAAASSPSPLMVQSQDNAIYEGSFSCNITNNFLNLLTNSTKYFHLTNIAFDVLVNFTSTSLDDNDNQNPVKASNSKVSPVVGRFHLNKNWPVLQTRQVFEQMVQNFVQKSRMAKAYGDFIAVIIKIVLQMAKIQCST